MHGVKKIKNTEALERERQDKNKKRIEAYNQVVAGVQSLHGAGDLGKAMLGATAKVLEQNCDYYSLYNYRRKVLEVLLSTASPEEIGALYQNELLLTQGCIAQNPKSYWAWHHRMWITSRLPTDWARELKLCAKMLQLDDRNFHCWTYRRYAAAQAGTSVADELAYTLERINTNFSNYSAWHYRSKLLPRLHTEPASFATAVADELELVQNAFYTEPNDQSGWLYQRWLLARAPVRVCLRDVRERRAGDGSVVVLTFSCPVQGVAGADVVTCEPAAAAGGNPAPAHALRHASGFCAVWVIPVTSGEHLESVSLTVGVTTADGAACETGIFGVHGCAGDGGGSAVAAHGGITDAATRAMLERELVKMDELLDIEPNSRWAESARLHIRRTLGHPVSELLPTVARLATLDPMRAGYYADLASDLRVEVALDELSDKDCSAVNFSGLELTRLGHTARIGACCSRLDVGRNALRTLEGVEILSFLEELRADDNALTAVAFVAHLPRLHVLSLRNNRIATVEALRGLAGAGALTHLDLRGNPVALGDRATLEASLRTWVPTLTNISM